MRCLRIVIVAFAVLATDPGRSHGFSVLAHQAVIDAAWEPSIVPALRSRFPGATIEQLARARAFAYGGSHIADLGYFPLGNVLFTNLVHYVRSGDFVTSLLESASTLEEYAFALGALSHWITDGIGHPEGTNRAVAELYPKLREKYGERVTYGDDHSAHLTTEFRFDVLQMARSPQDRDLLRHAVQFEVAEPVLDRAFTRTYGLRLGDLFTSTEVAIGTYRWVFRDLVHEATGIAWAVYRDDIQRLDPTLVRRDFVFDMSRADFEHEFGKLYREPGYFARFIGFLAKLVPNVGPLRRLPSKPLPPDVRQLFVNSLDRAVASYRTAVSRLRRRRLQLSNENLDTGTVTHRGEYRQADETYAALVEKLDQRDFAGVSADLRADILHFYADRDATVATTQHDPAPRVRHALDRLVAMPLRVDADGGRR